MQGGLYVNDVTGEIRHMTEYSSMSVEGLNQGITQFLPINEKLGVYRVKTTSPCLRFINSNFAITEKNKYFNVYLAMRLDANPHTHYSTFGQALTRMWEFWDKLYMSKFTYL